MQSVAPWLSIIIALLALITTIALFQKAQSVAATVATNAAAQKTIDGRFEAVDDTLKRFQGNHLLHFNADKEIGVQLSRLTQQVNDHDKHDDERFNRLEEGQSDVKKEMSSLHSRMSVQEEIMQRVEANTKETNAAIVDAAKTLAVIAGKIGLGQ